jgi:hypothetical protein
LVLLDQERFDLGITGVVAEDLMQQLHKRGLAVFPKAVEDGQ